MSDFNPLTSGEMVNGFPPTGKTIAPPSNGLSVFERTRAAIDYVYERMFLAGSSSSTAPLATTPINPASFALYGTPGNDGFRIGQFKRRSQKTIREGQLSVGYFKHVVEKPFAGNAMPVLHGFEFTAPNEDWPTGVTFPVFVYRPDGLYLEADAQLEEGTGLALLAADVSLWEIGSDGTGFTPGGVVATPAYDDLTDNDISGDAKFLAVLFRKIRNRLDYLKNALDGQTDATRINCQAIPEEASGSGKGLTVKMQQYTKRTNAAVVVGAGATVAVSTTVVNGTSLAPLYTPLLYSISGSNYAVRAYYGTISIAGTPFYHVFLVNTGSGSATVSVDSFFVKV